MKRQNNTRQVTHCSTHTKKGVFSKDTTRDSKEKQAELRLNYNKVAQVEVLYVTTHAEQFLYRELSSISSFVLLLRHVFWVCSTLIEVTGFLTKCANGGRYGVMENRVTGFGALQSVLATATDSMISFGMWLEVKTFKVELVIALRQEASLTFIYLIVAGNRDFDHEGFVAPAVPLLYPSTLFGTMILRFAFSSICLCTRVCLSETLLAAWISPRRMK